MSALLLLLFWRREPSDEDWFALPAFLLCLPALLVLGAPVLGYMALRDCRFSRLGAFLMSAWATTAAVCLGIVEGFWWTVAVAAAIGLTSLVTIAVLRRGAEESSENEEEYGTWRVIS